MEHKITKCIKTTGTSKQSIFPICYQIVSYIDQNKSSWFPWAISYLLVTNKPYLTTPGNAN